MGITHGTMVCIRGPGMESIRFISHQKNTRSMVDGVAHGETRRNPFENHTEDEEEMCIIISGLLAAALLLYSMANSH